MNLTDEINLFLETTRHLWNSYLRRNADWESVDVFKDICLKLFEEQILSRLDIKAPPIPMDSIKPFLTEYRIYSKFDTSLPIFVNRDIPPSGYWDHPINWIPSGENHTICPICFFDYRTQEWRKMEYFRVRIVDCKSNPELNGRDALVNLDNVEIEVLDKFAEQSGAL